MTHARLRAVAMPIDPRDAAIAAEIRADIARKRVAQVRIAAEAFHRPQQWLNRRLNAEVAFTSSELLTIGDYLDVNIVDWLERAKLVPPPGARRESTRPYVVPDLAAKGLRPAWTPVSRGHLLLVATG